MARSKSKQKRMRHKRKLAWKRRLEKRKMQIDSSLQKIEEKSSQTNDLLKEGE